MKTFATILLATMLVHAVFTQAAFAQSDERTEPDPSLIQLEDWLDYESVGSPQISPDCSEILYARRRIDKLNDSYVSTLWLMDRDGARNRQLMTGGSGLWSPSGDRIAYVDQDTNGNAQIFVRFMDDEGLVTQVTSFEHAPRSMAWSPDGDMIAFVARVPKDNDWSVSLPGRPKGAKWTDDPVIIDTLHYRQDRVGYTNSGYDHLFVVPAEGGTPRQLTEGEWNVGQRIIGAIATAPALSWSPDGAQIAFDGLTRYPEPAEWYVSDINVVDVDSGEITVLTDGTGAWAGPVFSPDGDRIAFTGYPEHDTSYPVPGLYTMRANGSGMTLLAGDLSDGPGNLHWSANSREIYFSMDMEGATNIWSSDLNGRVSAVTEGDQVIGFSSLSDRGAAAITLTKSDMPGEIAVMDNIERSSMRVLTDVNADVFHGKRFGKVEEIWYDATAENGDTARVQGWIVLPPNYDPTQKYPLLLSIHGGPHAMYDSGFSFTNQEFAARGYVVLYTNPRGSTGYGSDFANAIRHQYPGQFDYADLMAGVDVAIEKGYADRDRLFVTGCSGGGVLTTWVIAQTDRFKAAAALCPVTNWIGMSGTTDVVGWLYNFFPQPFWEDPQPWLDHSTIMQVGSVSTPTLLMTGTEDLRTPLAEAEEYYTALKMRGVPTKLIPMNGEYHGTRSKPSNYLRTSLYLRKWFEEYDPALADDEADEEERAED